MPQRVEEIEIPGRVGHRSAEPVVVTSEHRCIRAVGTFPTMREAITHTASLA